MDLPGIYMIGGLSRVSADERVARDYLLDGGVDVIVNIVDASNLERNLYLTTQLLEIGLPVVIALNMTDVAEKGGRIDVDALARLLSVRSSPLSPPKARERRRSSTSHLAHRRRLRSPRAAPVTAPKSRWRSTTCGAPSKSARMRGAGKVAAGQVAGGRFGRASVSPGARSRARTRSAGSRDPQHLERGFGGDVEAVIASGRYGFIGGLMREVVKRAPAVDKLATSDRIDNVLLHRVFGIPIFVALMLLTFKLTFDLGGVAQRLDRGSRGAWYLGDRDVLPPGPLGSLAVKGIIHGVGGVIVFLPNILIIFLIISFLEDSGYMARAAFLMDRSMHLVGLHGKSFIPMLMGFGCNVPAVMATRTLETRRGPPYRDPDDPLMSCTARLPIYILFAGVFFPRDGAMVIFSIYARVLAWRWRRQAVQEGALSQGRVAIRDGAAALSNAHPAHRAVAGMAAPA